MSGLVTGLNVMQELVSPAMRVQQLYLYPEPRHVKLSCVCSKVELIIRWREGGSDKRVPRMYDAQPAKRRGPFIAYLQQGGLIATCRYVCGLGRFGYLSEGALQFKARASHESPSRLQWSTQDTLADQWHSQAALAMASSLALDVVARQETRPPRASAVR